jgi:exodeoxyribonuclease VII large subunit
MSFTLTPSAGATRDIYTVSRLNREARLLLEGGFPLLWIEGEISNLARPASGHLYFSLKDSQCQVRCALFRQYQRPGTLSLRDGMHVILRARVGLYEGRGEFQLIAEHLEEAGEGALKRAFEILKARLTAEGLFDMARKRPLPRLPQRIGIITSPSGAVLHDILTTLQRRFPAIVVRLYPVPVQGEGAADKIAAAIRLAGDQRDSQALIVARGGGSLEDLWAFNEEVVARAIHRCPVPVVCGVGHETDFTIADFAADARAPTPTAAAEMLSPHWEEWFDRFHQQETRLARALRVRLLQLAQRVDGLAARIVHPRQRLGMVRQRLDALRHRLGRSGRQRILVSRHRLLSCATRLHQRSPGPRLRMLQQAVTHLQRRLESSAQRTRDRAGERLQRLASNLHALSPLATLARGYSILTDRQGVVVRDAARVSVGDRVRARLAAGELDCRVEGKRDA